MTFESEEVRGKFHELPAQRQYDYCELEVFLARQEKRLHIEDVTEEGGELKISVRIYEKSNFIPL